MAARPEPPLRAAFGDRPSAHASGLENEFCSRSCECADHADDDGDDGDEGAGEGEHGHEIVAVETADRKLDRAAEVADLTGRAGFEEGQVVLVFQDREAERRAEAELRGNEARMRSLVKLLQLREGTEQELLDHALEEALALTGSRYGYLYLYDADR